MECDCRKPKPGLVQRACDDFDIDRGASIMIGDKSRDVECAEAAGLRGVLYEGGSLVALLEQELGDGRK